MRGANLISLPAKGVLSTYIDLGHLGPDIQKRKYPRANKLIDAGKWELLGEELEVGS